MKKNISMKTIILNLLFVLFVQISYGQDNFYTKTYGNVSNPAIIFLHGGPGYNAFSFEFSTAQELSDNGFYVIVYDQRGCGRTKSDTNSLYTFEEAFADLNNIYTKHNVKTATLIGHSFGGSLGILYANNYPEKVENLILVGSPLSYQMTFKHIISRCKKIYTENSSPQLQYIEMLEKMDKNSIEYSSYSFMHAMQNRFYSPKNPTEEAKIIYSKFKTDTLLTKYASQMTYQAPQGFWKNEKYTTIDLTSNIKNVQAKNIKIRGLYGKDDGLYSADQVKKLQNLLGENNLKYIDNCSHNVFVDQQSQFIDALETWTK